jgi:hypothetical protein
MNNFGRADLILSLNFSQKWQIQGQKFVWTSSRGHGAELGQGTDFYLVMRELEKSRVLNIIEDLQIPDILEICYLYNLL